MPFLRLTEAIEYATEKHRGDYRDGDFALPYISHPLDVLNQLRYVGLITDEDLLIVAVLHDLLEETPATTSEIETLFGSNVLQLVIELTRFEPDIIGMNAKDAWELRSRTLLGEIAKMSPEAMTVKLGDRLSNLRQAKVTRKPAKVERYCRQTQKILEIIPETVNPRLWRAILAELG